MDEYGILGGYEDGLDEDDKQGSRAVPSRTDFGNESAFVEKFPCYGGHRWGIRNFPYQCLLTMPQIEIMSADLPHTLYRDKRSSPGQKDIADAEKMMREAYEKKKKRREKEGFTIDEVFNEKADIDSKENKD